MKNVGFDELWSQNYATPVPQIMTRYFSQRLGAIVAFLAYRGKLGPSQLSLIGIGTMLSASLTLALASRDGALPLLPLVLYQLGFAIDCADGQLARATRTTSLFGAWLDHVCDHARSVSMVVALGAVLIVDGMPGWAVASAVFLFGAGSVVSIHTASMLREGSYPPHGLRGFADYARSIVMNVVDTPVVLLLVCLLARHGVLLAAYISLIGMFCLMQAIVLARLRLGGPGSRAARPDS